MNIFGITIQTKKSLAAALAAVAAPPVVDTDTRPESVRFGEAYNKGAARQILDTLAQNARDADKSSKIALYVSIPHQALYMLSQAEGYFRHAASTVALPILVLEIAIAAAICLVVPYLVDRAILMNIRTVGTRAASTWSKVRAGVVLGVTLPWSMWVNFSAPGADIVKYGAAGLVALVAIYQVSRLVSPSFTKMGKSELKAKAELADIQQAAAAASGTTVAAPAPKTSTADLNRRKQAAAAFATANPNVTAGQLVKLHNITRDAAKKILATVGNARTPLAPAAAPTSPAPAGMDISATYQQV